MGGQCSTSPKTIDCFYDIASHAGLVPDTSLDSSLASLLSINSSQTLVHQYSALQSQMTRQQRSDFNRDLHTTFGRNSTVSFGGVGVVALALSVLFEVLAHHRTTRSGQRNLAARPPPPDPIRRIFGAGGRSEISSIASEFLKQVPGAANDRVKMTELLEVYEGKLRSELNDFYDRMVLVNSRARSSDGVKQWLNGAALHIHVFLHWKRLTDPSASEVLSLHYLRALDPLIKSYEDYLLETVKVSSASSQNPSGILIVEPQRNASHELRHRVCESKAIQRALVERFMSQQDLQTVKRFLQNSHDRHDALMAQRARFQLSMGRDWKQQQKQKR